MIFFIIFFFLLKLIDLFKSFIMIDKLIKKRKRKETIPLKEKIKTWKRYCLLSDPCLAPCQTCDRFVKCPLAIRSKFDINNQLTTSKYNKNRNGEFGHITSEKNGGRAVSENLTIQCKECNTRQGSKNIVIHTLNAYALDAFMLDNEDRPNRNSRDLEPMDIDQAKFCLAYTSKGVQCKNKACHSDGTCSIHTGI